MNKDLVGPSGEKPRVLFACTGNTCRSVIAEFIARKKLGHVFEVSSAGFQPQAPQDAENAIHTLKAVFDIDASGHEPRDIRSVNIESFDIVVAMDSRVARRIKEVFPAYPVERLMTWQIDDPYGDDLADYQRCAQAISVHLKKLPVRLGNP
jgi:ArsR family transcriptional regulator, arsenate/arsenite/antimonite-responsive transcriptional repressor / arsenate reductase (thioredoxin)